MIFLYIGIVVWVIIGFLITITRPKPVIKQPDNDTLLKNVEYLYKKK